jgi:hypothetical protein
MSVADVTVPRRDQDHLPDSVDAEGPAVEAEASVMILIQVTMIGKAVGGDTIDIVLVLLDLGRPHPKSLVRVIVEGF